jgi:HAD superfamily hydrolase (TIGR01549 family)
MIPKVVSFDCAQTLLEVDWSVSRYIADLCADIALEIPISAPRRYEEMYGERLQDYVQVNMTRDHAACDAWWIRLGAEWLSEFGLDPTRAQDLHDASMRLGFGPESILFRLYEDVIETIESLRRGGIKLAVLSNWDYTLQRALEGSGIFGHFDLVVASLEYGVEKPDPRLFQVLTDHFRVDSSEIVHVGDNPHDDLEGARRAGMRGVLIDRSQPRSEDPILHDLRKIVEAFEWNG